MTTTQLNTLRNELVNQAAARYIAHSTESITAAMVLTSLAEALTEAIEADEPKTSV